MQGCQKNIFILDQISFFSLRIPKCEWFIYIYTGNICILQLKKTARWCFGTRHWTVPFLLFPSNNTHCWIGWSKFSLEIPKISHLLCLLLFFCADILKVKFMNNQPHICIRKRALHNTPMVAHRRSTGKDLLILNISTTLGWVNSSMPQMLCSQ